MVRKVAAKAVQVLIWAIGVKFDSAQQPLE